MVKVKVIRKYNDLELGCILDEGQEITVTKKRADLLLRRGFVREMQLNKVKSEPLE